MYIFSYQISFYFTKNFYLQSYLSDSIQLDSINMAKIFQVYWLSRKAIADTRKNTISFDSKHIARIWREWHRGHVQTVV